MQGESRPMLMLDKPAEQISVPLTEVDREEASLVQAVTKHGNVVLCDQYVAKQVKKQRNMLTQSMMVKREKRDALPWNKARQTMRKFYKDNPKYDYYQYKKRPYKDIDVATEEFLHLSSKIGEQMEKVFGKGLDAPKYEEPQHFRNQDIEGSPDNNNNDDQRSQTSSNMNQQLQGSRTAFNKQPSKMPGFAAFKKEQSLKSS